MGIGLFSQESVENMFENTIIPDASLQTVRKNVQSSYSLSRQSHSCYLKPSTMTVSTNVADFALKLMRDTHMISFISPAVGSNIRKKTDDK
ncbi:hypothetical protein BTVI_73978 [Pitangus sulphuratus]|nr:hypothetical protein BTVI_73978 [Pitangus sulphuratus]